MQGHVDIGGEDDDQQEDDADGADLSRFRKAHADSQNDFSEAGDIDDLRCPGQEIRKSFWYKRKAAGNG